MEKTVSKKDKLTFEPKGWFLNMVEYAEEASPGVSKEGITSSDDVAEVIKGVSIRHPIPYSGSDRAYLLKLKDGRYTFIHTSYGEEQGSKNWFWMAMSDSFINLQKLVKEKFRHSTYITSSIFVFKTMEIACVGPNFDLSKSKYLSKKRISEWLSKYPDMRV